ncbi:MAG TPA: FG-GAP-like repeat-containing protein [Thermoanaerobaculia bacterium]|nr:FG-GAP-like repeat-containing protein [Thermoanaerobaculia bacterium]
MAILAGGLLAVPAAPQPGPYPGPEETRAELEAVCRSLTESDNPYFGWGSLRRLERLLPHSMATAERVAVLAGIGVELVRLDRLDEGIERLESALALTEELSEEAARPQRLLLLKNLGLAYLQRSEDQHCIGMRTSASCILPIRAEAVHGRPEAIRRAGDLFLGALESDPADVSARWLLNLARMLEGTYPEGVPPELRIPEGGFEPEAAFPRWIDIGGALSIAAVDLSGGAVMDDFDGDGILDLISSSWDPCEPLKAFRGDGRGGFEDVTRAWGLDAQLGGLNLVHADYDGDGALDLLVLRGAWLGEDGLIRNSLLRNDLLKPTGRFEDVTAAAGLAYPAYPTQTAAWADYDGDGHLDLAIGNESPREGSPYPTQLFRNRGDGTFSEVTWEARVTNFRYAKGVAWGDFDGDGRPDLYVSNIGPNRLYRNGGPGEGGAVTFTDVAPELEVDEPSGASFATWFFDYDQDGDLDLYVGRYDAPVEAVQASYLGLPVQGGAPVVYRNDGGRFTDVSEELGLRRPLLPMGANYGDLDNDGFPDIVLGTGVPDYNAVMPDVVYRNDRGGRFLDVTFASGLAQIQKGHGVAFGDFDRDGDQDLFRQLGGAFPFDAAPNALYENPGSENAWIAVQLSGRRANRSGLGARIEARVRRGEEAWSRYTVVSSGGSFGGSSLVQGMGLGTAEELLALTVSWQGSGCRQRFESLPLERYYRIEESDGAPAGRD